MSSGTRRRAKGSGTVYRQGRIWWIAYSGADGKRVAESTHSERKGDATRLLQRRVGAREHGLPVIPNVEQYTFEEAAKGFYARARPEAADVAPFEKELRRDFRLPGPDNAPGNHVRRVWRGSALPLRWTAMPAGKV